MHPPACPVPKSTPPPPSHPWQHLPDVLNIYLQYRLKKPPALLPQSFSQHLQAILVFQAGMNVPESISPRLPWRRGAEWSRSTRCSRSDADSCTSHLAGLGGRGVWKMQASPVFLNFSWFRNKTLHAGCGFQLFYCVQLLHQWVQLPTGQPDHPWFHRWEPAACTGSTANHA